MIPNSEDLIKKVSHPEVEFMLLNGPNYFSIADEYVSLQKIFVKEGVYETISLWFDMIISPLLTILHSIWKQAMPSMFTVLSFQKCVNLWKKWVRFQDLKKHIYQWTKIIHTIGGPFISSNDAEYHVFVYADAMQRLHSGLGSLISEKCAKRVK